jgi:hypothetical protein
MKIGNLNECMAAVAAGPRANLLLTFMIAALAWTRDAHGAVHYQVLKSFGSVTNDGQYPAGRPANGRK